MNGLGNRTEFENEWQKAFSNAEIEPSEDVWRSIDTALANNDAERYKRKAFYYKLVAAASIVIAIALGIFGVLTPEYDSTTISSTETKTISSEGNNNQEATSESDKTNEVFALRDNKQKVNEPTDQSIAKDETVANDEGFIASKKKVTKPKTTTVSALAKNELLFPPTASEENEEVLEQSNTLVLADKIGVEQLETDVSLKNTRNINKVLDLKSFYAITNPKNNEPNDLWAGVSFAGGSFDPNFSTESTPSLNFANSFNNYSRDWTENSKLFLDEVAVGNTNPYAVTQTINKESDPGISYSMGFNVGGKIVKKLVFQSGLHYAKKVTSSSTSLLIKDENNNVYPLHVSNSARLASENYMFNYQYSGISISNNYQFLSIPLKIGYTLMDEKFGATLFSGVSSEIFIGNKIEDEGAGLESVNIKPGEESPYRNIWLNGLISMELKYNLGGLYSLFLEPSYRISLNSFTKPNFIYSSRPNNFNVGIGFKMNIN